MHPSHLCMPTLSVIWSIHPAHTHNFKINYIYVYPCHPSSYPRYMLFTHFVLLIMMDNTY